MLEVCANWENGDVVRVNNEFEVYGQKQKIETSKQLKQFFWMVN